jgi:hypothetical protein
LLDMFIFWKYINLFDILMLIFQMLQCFWFFNRSGNCSFIRASENHSRSMFTALFKVCDWTYASSSR